MPQVENIRDLYENEGLSLREIARRTRKDFRTVQKYAYQDNWNPPVKLKTGPEAFPVMGEYIPIVNEWLEQDERELSISREWSTCPPKTVHSAAKNGPAFRGLGPFAKSCINMQTEEQCGRWPQRPATALP